MATAKNSVDDSQGRLTGTQSIERALLLLREIAAHNRAGSRLLDLATRTNLQRPTVHRMLKCLAHEGMVQQDSETHRYFLGPMAFELGLTAAPRFNLREICHPAMTRIAEATGDTVFLTQRSGLDAVCIDRHEGTFPIKTFIVDRIPISENTAITIEQLAGDRLHLLLLGFGELWLWRRQQIENRQLLVREAFFCCPLLFVVHLADEGL